jgi:phage terminase Nu1 subunit (DNA packaging protein)
LVIPAVEPATRLYTSLSGYARHRGCHPHAVEQAIQDGRLSTRAAAKEPGGRRWRIDVALSDKEWAALTGEQGPGGAADIDRDAVVEARVRRQLAQAEIAELDLAERRGELVSARDVETRIRDVFAHCRNRLLGVPSRARQRDPAITVGQIRLIEELIREALEELSGGLRP